MKLPCAIIRDLLPLYHDNVCAPDTAAAVEEHLVDCAACQEVFHNLQEGEGLVSPPPNLIPPQAAGLQRVKRRIHRKYAAIALGVLLACVGLAAGLMTWLNVATADFPIDDLLDVQFTTEWEGLYPNGGALRLTFTEDSPQVGLNYRAIPLDKSRKDTEWVLVISRRSTLAMDISAKLRFPPWEYENATPNLYNLGLNWRWYEPGAYEYGIEPPPEKWDSFISRAYYFEDYDLMNRLSPELSPEKLAKVLQDYGIVIWERPEDLP